MANHIYFTGDTHGWDRIGYRGNTDGILPRLNTTNFPEQKEMDRRDYVIILGDFGGIWACNGKQYLPENCQYLHFSNIEKIHEHGETSKEKDGLDWLENKSFTTLFIPGNHENYNRLYGAYPTIDYCCGKAKQIRPHVLMLMNGYVFNIAKKKIFTFGGAHSHDIIDGVLDPGEPEFKQNNKLFVETYHRWQEYNRMFRVKNISWWEQESPSQQMRECGLDSLENAHFQVDYILTHCAPTNLVRTYLGYGGDDITDYLQKIEKITDYKAWFFGHYHDNMTMHIKSEECTEYLLYEQIVKAC